MIQIQKMFLTPDQWVRPQSKLKGVEGLVWHWVANPLSTAIGNRNFFENRTGSYGSAHYIIGLQGEKIQCLPEDEIGYHVGSHVYTSRSLRELGSYPNNNTLGIECTHINWDGKMTDETYEALIELSVDILKRHNLTADDIWLHQEVVGWKDCHRWFVRYPEEYRKAKEEVARRMNQKAPKPPVKVDPKDIDMPKLDSNGMYKVEKGDTLWAISRAFDVTVEQLEKLNPNVKAKALQLGDKIKVKAKVQHVSNPVKPQIKPDMKTNSIVTYLNSIKEDSSYGNRAKLAAKHGIKGYSGTGAQNTLLLSILRDGKKVSSKPISKPKPKKSITQMAQEIIDNKHGNGHENRQKSLGVSASEYDKVRAEVNRLLGAKPSKPKKTISQMADEIIKGIHGSGHENRRKSLGISKAEYEKVRAEVNKRL